MSTNFMHLVDKFNTPSEVNELKVALDDTIIRRLFITTFMNKFMHMFHLDSYPFINDIYPSLLNICLQQMDINYTAYIDVVRECTNLHLDEIYNIMPEIINASTNTGETLLYDQIISQMSIDLLNIVNDMATNIYFQMRYYNLLNENYIYYYLANGDGYILVGIVHNNINS